MITDRAQRSSCARLSGTLRPDGGRPRRHERTLIETYGFARCGQRLRCRDNAAPLPDLNVTTMTETLAAPYGSTAPPNCPW